MLGELALYNIAVSGMVKGGESVEENVVDDTVGAMLNVAEASLILENPAGMELGVPTTAEGRSSVPLGQPEILHGSTEQQPANLLEKQV